MFSLLLASIFLVLLEASAKRPSLLWWTPPLMLLWARSCMRDIRSDWYSLRSSSSAKRSKRRFMRNNGRDL